MRRHRKPRVLWLPTLGERFDTGEGATQPVTGVTGSISNTGAIDTDDIVFDAFSVVPDAPTQDVQQDTIGDIVVSLHDIASGNAYRLRRVVGKFFCSFTQDQSPAQQAIKVGFGLMVCRTSPDGFPTTDFLNCNPLVRTSQEDPWIFHRTWVLGGGDESGATATWAGAPATNTRYGSVADGPHIDQRTARLVSNDERLFGVVAASPMFPERGTYTIDYWCQLRFLASLRSQQGNKRNASR